MNKKKVSQRGWTLASLRVVWRGFLNRQRVWHTEAWRILRVLCWSRVVAVHGGWLSTHVLTRHPPPVATE